MLLQLIQVLLPNYVSKTACVLTPAVLLCFLVNAQVAIGPVLGASRNYLYTDISQMSYTRLDPDNGLVTGAKVQYHLTKKLWLHASPGFLKKNYSYVRSGPYTGIYTSYLNSYLQLPLAISLELKRKQLSVYMSAGVYWAYWIKATVKGAIADIYSAADSTGSNGQLTETLRLVDYSTPYQFDTRKDRRNEWGVQGTIGIQLNFSNSNSLLAEAGYSRSLTSQQKKYMLYQARQLNQTCQITVGLLHYFRLNNTR